MQSMIVYNMLNVLNYFITYSYCYRPRDISGINNKTVKTRL
jgi:hypothetical protein